MATASFGGYDYEFVDHDKGLNKYICTVCTKVFRDPHLTGCCGQHYCESCLENWFTKHRRVNCPHCQAEGKEFQHLLDKKFKREIDSLEFHCTNKEEGCQWIGELESLKDHLESANGCDYAEIECTNSCKKKLKRKDLSNHLSNECPLRPYQCEHCGHKDTYQNITGIWLAIVSRQRHYDQCPEFPLECPNKCGVKDIKRKDMEDHCGQCSEEWVECPNRCMKQHEALYYRLKRKSLAKHLKDECELRRFKCVDCGLQDHYKTITTEHYDKCPEFPLECPNKCGRNDIKRKDMEDHRSRCPEEWVECSNGCNRYENVKEIKRKNLAKHLKDECKLRLYKCVHCGLQDRYETITTQHYDTCVEFPLECPNKCGRNDIKRKDMEDHPSQCPEEPVQCLFEEAGCKEKLVRHELEQHMSANQQQHLLMVMGAYKEMKNENEGLKQENLTTVSAYRQEIQQLKQVNGDIREELQQTIHDYQRQIADLELTHEVTRVRRRSLNRWRNLRRCVRCLACIVSCE